MNHSAYVSTVVVDGVPLALLTDILDPIILPLSAPFFYLKVQNLSNYALYLSFDGINYNDYLPAYDTVNLQSDTVFNRQKMVYPVWPKGQVIWASVVDFPFIDPPRGSVLVTGFTSFTEKGM